MSLFKNILKELQTQEQTYESVYSTVLQGYILYEYIPAYGCIGRENVPYVTMDEMEGFRDPNEGTTLAIFNEKILLPYEIFVTEDNHKIMREFLTGTPIPIFKQCRQNGEYEFCKGVVPDEWRGKLRDNCVSLEYLKKAKAYYVVKSRISKIESIEEIEKYQEKHQDIEQFKREIEEAIARAIETQKAIISTLEYRRDGYREDFNTLVKSLKNNWQQNN